MQPDELKIAAVIVAAAVARALMAHDQRLREHRRLIRLGLISPDPVPGPQWDPSGAAAHLYAPRDSLATRAGRAWGRIQHRLERELAR